MLRTLVFLPERPWKKVAVVRGVDVFFCRFGGVSVTGKRRTARVRGLSIGMGTLYAISTGLFILPGAKLE